MSKKYVLEGILQKSDEFTKNRPYEMKHLIRPDKRKLHLAIQIEIVNPGLKKKVKTYGEAMKCTGKPFAVIRKVTYSEEQFLRISGISPNSVCKKCLKKIAGGVKVGYSTGIL